MIGYNTKIIIYLRRNDLRLDSQFVQIIKSGNPIDSIEDFLVKSPKNYFKLIEDWAIVFGTENIIVRPLEKTQIPDLISDFLKIAGLKNSKNEFNLIEDKNIKPGLDQVIALKYLFNWLANKKRKPGDFKNNYLKFNKAIARNFLKFSKDWETPKDYKLLPFEKAKELLAEETKWNQKIANKYLENQNELFVEPLKYYQNASLELNQMSNDNLLDFMKFLKTNFQLTPNQIKTNVSKSLK